MRGSFAIAGLLIAAAALGGRAEPAWADDEPAPIGATIETNGGTVVASFDVTGAFTEAFRKRITNGLRNLALIEVTLRDSEGRLIGQSLRHCHFKLEIWDEILTVRWREAGRRSERGYQVFDRGLKECGQVNGIEVADLGAMTAQRGYHLEIAVLLNPVDQETLQAAREFLSNPRSKNPGRPLTLFGSVARLFSDKPEAGGERFRFRSRGLERPRK
jgi:hypothetical protein